MTQPTPAPQPKTRTPLEAIMDDGVIYDVEKSCWRYRDDLELHILAWAREYGEQCVNACMAASADALTGLKLPEPK